MIQDVVVERARQRAGIDQFLRVDPGGRAAGQVADVVGSGAARGQPQFVDRHQHVERMRGADLADLQIGAGGDVDIAAAEVLGDLGQARRLVRRHDAAGQSEAQHERGKERQEDEVHQRHDEAFRRSEHDLTRHQRDEVHFARIRERERGSKNSA